MYKRNYFHIMIVEDMSEGIEVAGHPTVQGANHRTEGTKAWSVWWEAAEGMFLDIFGASFVKDKSNSNISGFDKSVGGKHKVGAFWNKGEVRIDEGGGIALKFACVGGHREFAEF